ncbi:MAG: hypothetical protein ACTSUE_21510 [Promethearchaeota archaeon]
MPSFGNLWLTIGAVNHITFQFIPAGHAILQGCSYYQAKWIHGACRLLAEYLSIIFSII